MESIKTKINHKDIKAIPSFEVKVQILGINSEVMIKEFSDGEKKVICHYGARKGGFIVSEAEEMVKDIIQYQRELEKYQIPLPVIEDIYLENNFFLKKAIIIKESKWTGQEVAELIKDADMRKDLKKIEKLVEEMCNIINLVCMDRTGWETKVGIDPRSTNFTIDKNGKMWFLDLFPPRYRKNGIPLIEWPAPQSALGRELGNFKHFDVRGIYLCLLAQLARIKPELKMFFEEIILNKSKQALSKREYSEFVEDLFITPWFKLRNIIRTGGDKERIKEIIMESLSKKVFGINYNIYTLREIALELAAVNIITLDQLHDFFHNSHFEDELPNEKLDLLEQILLSYI